MVKGMELRLVVFNYTGSFKNWAAVGAGGVGRYGLEDCTSEYLY